jgi:hypothetical protein
MCNGLEDAAGTPTVKLQWMYWDGKILRAGDGKYHMFADRWSHANGMGDWVNSDTSQKQPRSSPHTQAGGFSNAEIPPSFRQSPKLLALVQSANGVA